MKKNIMITGLITILLIAAGCTHCTWNFEIIDYTPLSRNDWMVSTPEDQGLDPMLVAKLYFNAAKQKTLYGLLVIKNGYLIAEKYFNAGWIDQISGRQSATKSFTSSLVGIALDQGIISSIDQKMMFFFPEYADQVIDPRKNQITIKDLLQMRGGYPWEETTPPYMDLLFFSDNWHWQHHIVDFPLVCNPGTDFNYSNLTSHILGIIVSRASGQDLKSFARKFLFTPMEAAVGEWIKDADGYYFGNFEIMVTARDMARYGLLYLNKGNYKGNQIISADWIENSLKRYSEGMNFTGWFPGITSEYGSFHDLGYGYQWWSAKVGKHEIKYASGHGGNYIILLADLNMIVVTTADPLHNVPLGDQAWAYEGAINKMVGTFIKSLPGK